MDFEDPLRVQHQHPKPFLYPSSDLEITSVLPLGNDGSTSSSYVSTTTSDRAEHSSWTPSAASESSPTDAADESETSTVSETSGSEMAGNKISTGSEHSNNDVTESMMDDQDGVAQDQDQKKLKRKRRTSNAWLYRDLSLEDEYNITTEYREDLEDEEDFESWRLRKPVTPPPVAVSDVPDLPREAHGLKPRVPGHHYTEFHFHQWFQNINDSKRRIKSMGCFVVFEPEVIRIKDFMLSTVIQEDKEVNKDSKKGLKRSLVSDSDDGRHNDESHLPFKKRKRYCSQSSEYGSQSESQTKVEVSESGSGFGPASAEDTFVATNTSEKPNFTSPSDEADCNTDAIQSNTISSTDLQNGSTSVGSENYNVSTESESNPTSMSSDQTGSAASPSRTREHSSASYEDGSAPSSSSCAASSSGDSQIVSTSHVSITHGVNQSSGNNCSSFTDSSVYDVSPLPSGSSEEGTVSSDRRGEKRKLDEGSYPSCKRQAFSENQ